LDPCAYDIFDSESALELNPEVVTLTPGTPCICKCLVVTVCGMTYSDTVFHYREKARSGNNMSLNCEVFGYPT